MAMGTSLGSCRLDSSHMCTRPRPRPRRVIMELLVSVAIGELVSRSMSMAAAAYRGRRERPPPEESLRRLRQLLLRVRAVVEEAEGRHVTNRGMLRQLERLRDDMFRGCYLLDAARCRHAGAGDDEGGGKEKGPEVSRSFALSRFNPAKRFRRSASSPSSSSSSKWMVFEGGKEEDLPEAVRRLETAIADMKEFVVFLAQYPPILRRPYGAHLFLDKCMFGRHMEHERVVEFLLQPEAPCGPGGDGLAGILPIVGPAQIGKSTLVEHVCADERVRRHFSTILFHHGHGGALAAGDETPIASLIDGCGALAAADETPITSLLAGCVVKHKDHASRGRLLLVIELAGHIHFETRRALQKWSSSSPDTPMAAAAAARGIVKIIITSQDEEIARLGTTPPLRLRPLPPEAYWYFFKLRLFGSTDPEDHPKLASTAMAIAGEMKGSFLYGNIFCGVMRTQFTAQFWRRVLLWMRKYMRTNGYLFGEYPDDVTVENRPACAWVLAEPSKQFLAYKPYHSLGEDEHPKITMQDVLSGKSEVGGDTEVLLWRSQIPPYYNTMTRCVIRSQHRGASNT